MTTGEERALLAHDLKTPIAVIVGCAELLAARDDEETRTVAAEQILAAAERLSQAIDELLGLDPPQLLISRVEAPEKTEARGARTSRSRVVIVDDDPALRKLLRLTLPPDEFEIAEANDGGMVLDLIEAQRPDLVVLDWNMPTVSGADVLRILKDRYPTLPVIVLTAAAQERGHAEALHADAFLAKPYSPLGLLKLIEDLISRAPTNTPA